MKETHGGESNKMVEARRAIEEALVQEHKRMAIVAIL